ncbi:reverse transcriptase domain-containing protein [Tanacetum coccineum]|uniref:Reverse transcriptase domain-containing protein n=1 Tax=Tanacetum coccineum TaxID=301880 RepID=A0ABQ5FCA4_9ASTR
MLLIQVAKLVVVHIIIPSVKPPVVSLKGTYMLLRETTIREGALPSNTIPNPREDIKVITTWSGITLVGPSGPSPNPSSSSKEVEQDSKTTMNQMFKKLHFNISFAEALAQMPKYAKIELEECMALADLGASLNLMPFSMWKKLMLPELVPTRMTLELANRSTSKYPHKHGDESINQIDIIDTTSEGSMPVDLTRRDLPPRELKNDETKMTKSSIEEPPELELKGSPLQLEYAFLEGTSKLRVIIAKDLKREEKDQLIKVLRLHKLAIAWKISDIKGIDPNFCTYKILMEDDFKPVVQHQRRVNPKIHEVIKAKVIKLLDAGLIYPISDSPWVSHVHVVPKKGGMTVVTNDNNELIPTRLVTGWRVCIDYQKLNDVARKYHFPLPFMDKMLERLAGNEFYYFLDGFSGMPFGLCNALGTFQRCMVANFHDMIEKTMEVFMDDFLAFGDSFSSCLAHLDMMFKRCEDTNLVLNWEKYHFMVKEGIILGHKISKNGIEVDRAKVDVIAKLPPPITVKGIRSFLEAPILVAPDRDLPFEIMCDASDFAVGAVSGKRKNKYFQPIHYASKTLSDAQTHYTTTKKELLAVVYAFEKLWSYLVLSKTIFDIEIRDKKGAENLEVDHLSRLENPHKGDLAEMEMNDNFPHKYLNMIVLNDDNEPPWFTDIANYLVERKVGEHRAKWADKLDDALWAFRTAFKTPIGFTPYKIVYGKACHLPIELEHKIYWALKWNKFDLKTTGDHRKREEMDEIFSLEIGVPIRSLSFAGGEREKRSFEKSNFCEKERRDPSPLLTSPFLDLMV